MKEKKTSVYYSVTPCPKDNKVLPKNVKNVVDEDKNESLKETKTESEVAFNDNLKKFVNKIRNKKLEQAKTADSEDVCDENSEIMRSIHGLERLDENGIGINYEGDETDKSVNNDNKSTLHDYHLSQYISSQTSNTSLTQLSETSLSNVRTNLDFDLISIMSQKRKRTLNDNFLSKKHLKKNTLS